MKHPELMKHVPEFIESMQELIKRYQGALKLGISKREYENKLRMRCLLCNPLGTTENRENVDWDMTHFKIGGNDDTAACAALGCPWITILGETCYKFSERKLEGKSYTGYGIYGTYFPVVMKARIKQLRNWIKIYSEFKK